MILSVVPSSCVNDHAQGSPFRELLAQRGFKRRHKARFDVLFNEGRGHRDREGFGSQVHRDDVLEPYPEGGGVYLAFGVPQYAGPELFGRRVGSGGREADLGVLGGMSLRFLWGFVRAQGGVQGGSQGGSQGDSQGFLVGLW